MPHDPNVMPEDVPAPVDDGAADHLVGAPVPAIALPSTTGGRMRVDETPPGMARLVLYAYPRTGQPGVEPLRPDWDAIPGARGCTPEACGFRDHTADLTRLGAAVAGVSTQSTDYQAEAARRLRLTFPLLSDAEFALTRSLRLPTFEVAGQTLLRRLTMVIRDGRIEHVFYPVFPPDRHAEQVIAWLRPQPAAPQPEATG
jgi:peroxiredoxin